MTEIISVIIGALGVIGAIVATVVSVKVWKRTKCKDAASEVGADVELRADLKYIIRGVDDIKIEQRGMREDFGRLSERVSKIEGRLDDHINQH
jgi:hypothetical protein